MKTQALSFITKSRQQTIQLGQRLGKLLQKGDIIAMTGTLAAGKTTITKGIALALGVQEEVTSPTFCLVSEYQGKSLPLYHIDAYRLEGDSDFIDIGAEDFLYGGGVCVIEWSERLKDSLPQNTITLDFDIDKEQNRLITIKNWPYGDVNADDL